MIKKEYKILWFFIFEKIEIEYACTGIPLFSCIIKESCNWNSNSIFWNINFYILYILIYILYYINLFYICSLFIYIYIYRNFQYQLYYGISCINKTDLIIEFYYLLLLMQKYLLLIRTIDNELVLNTWNNLSTQPITINLSLAL